MIASGRIRLATAALGVALVSVTFAAPAAAEPPPSGIVHSKREPGMSKVDYGKELFAGNCSSCHGSRGQGITSPRPNTGAGNITGQGPDLRGVGAIAPDFYLRTGRMPLMSPTEKPERHAPFFNDREIHALTAYIASLGKGPPIPRPEPRRDALASGLHLYTEHCAGCHQIAGEGGYVTDTKVPVLQHATARDIAEAVRIGPYLMPSFSTHDISDRELNAIIAYVRRSHHPQDAGGVGIGHIGPVPEGMVTWAVAGLGLIAICAILGAQLRKS